MTSSPPQIPLTLNMTAYARSSSESQALALNAQRHVTSGRLDLALRCLKQLLKDRRLEANPLIIDGYMMLARLASDYGQLADACAYLQLAADPSALTFDGPQMEHLSTYNTAKNLIRDFQSILKKPRMLCAPARHFETETNFDCCHLDSLRSWALGHDLPMPAEEDRLGVEELRGALTRKQIFPPPTIYYLLIPPRGKPFTITPEAAPKCLLGFAAPKLDMRTQMLYNGDLLERAMGNVRGWPEGHFFQLYEMIMYNQYEARLAKFERNSQAMDFLHYEGDIYGSVLVQMSYLLKHRETRMSLIAARQPPSAEFLGSAEWKTMRMEFRAFDLTRSYSMDITPDQVALKGDRRFHRHLA